MSKMTNLKDYRGVYVKTILCDGSNAALWASQNGLEITDERMSTIGAEYRRVDVFSDQLKYDPEDESLWNGKMIIGHGNERPGRTGLLIKQIPTIF